MGWEPGVFGVRTRVFWQLIHAQIGANRRIHMQAPHFDHCEHQTTPTKQQSTKHLITIVSPAFSFIAAEVSDLFWCD
jgi:hypothetical protein